MVVMGEPGGWVLRSTLDEKTAWLSGDSSWCLTTFGILKLRGIAKREDQKIMDSHPFLAFVITI